MGTIGARGDKEATGAAEVSTAIRKASAARCPSIDIAFVDDAVDYHLMPKIADLWPPPPSEEKGEDLTEALRTDVRVAIQEVLTRHGVRLVTP